MLITADHYKTSTSGVVMLIWNAMRGFLEGPSSSRGLRISAYQRLNSSVTEAEDRFRSDDGQTDGWMGATDGEDFHGTSRRHLIGSFQLVSKSAAGSLVERTTPKKGTLLSSLMGG